MRTNPAVQFHFSRIDAVAASLKTVIHTWRAASCEYFLRPELPISETPPRAAHRYRKSNLASATAQGSLVAASSACWKLVRCRTPSGRDADCQPGPQAATIGGRGRVPAAAASWW